MWSNGITMFSNKIIGIPYKIQIRHLLNTSCITTSAKLLSERTYSVNEMTNTEKMLVGTSLKDPRVYSTIKY